MGKLKKAKAKAKGSAAETGGKAAAKAAKKAKGEKKAANKDVKAVKKKKGKGGGKDENDMDEADLIKTLEAYRAQWQADHKVSEEVVAVPSRRANATLTACPVKDHLYLFGGEYYDGQTVEIYADMFRYSPEKNEWRLFSSPEAPGPRSAHQIVASPAGGGKLWLFGGEFSAPNQSSFHHYRDLWCFDISTHSWERFDTKQRPSARSGHRMAMYKHLMFLFGGFQDTGIRTSYLGDLWCWDTLNYRWHQIEFGPVDRKPDARSGFSFIPCAEGVILHGGYRKTYDGKRSTGVGEALSDTWLLRVPPASEDGVVDYRAFKWEKRKNPGYAPSTRSGCTMALWSAKNMGVLFGGVSDDDKDEETLDSTFYNELFGYNMAGNGRWISLPLKKKKKKGGGNKRKAKAKAARPTPSAEEEDAAEDTKMDEGEQGSDNEGDEDEDDGPKPWELAQQAKEEQQAAAEEDDPDDPEKSVPFARYNTMLAVQRNTLYVYGGILESGDREWTLDDFFTLQLDKLDRFNCLKECIIENVEWHGSDSENDSSGSESESGSDDDSSSEDDDGKAPEGEDVEMKDVKVEKLQLTDAEQAALDAERAATEREELRKRATAFAGVSASADRTAEDMISTPQPGETLAKFFARSKEYWTQKAHSQAGAGSRGKELRRDGFQLAEEAFQEYAPLLAELARIQEQAGLDAAEAAKGARAGLGTDSRNRR